MSGTQQIEEMVDKWLGDEPSPDASPEPQDTPNEANDTPQEEGEPQQSATPDAETKPATGEQPKSGVDSQRPPDKAQQQTKPGPGDLVDGQGRLIAKAGAERRHYETAQRATRDLHETRQNLQRVTTELNAFREAAQLPNQLGLNVEETTTGLQLAAAWKSNPTGVIQYLVEQAKAAGYSLDGIGGNTDMGAIKQMIASELAPFRQQAQTLQQTQQAQTAAQNELSNFVAEYGEAALTNSEALAKIIDASQDAGRPMSLEQAYFRFNRWCQDNGIDPHQPIDPQLAARQQAPAPQQRTPAPRGRPATANGVVPLDNNATMSGNETSRDVVRAAMREAGLQV